MTVVLVIVAAVLAVLAVPVLLLVGIALGPVLLVGLLLIACAVPFLALERGFSRYARRW